MECDNKMEGKELKLSTKNILKKKIFIKTNLMPVNLEDNQTPLDLSDKSKVIPHFEPTKILTEQTPVIITEKNPVIITEQKPVIITEKNPVIIQQIPKIRVVHHANLGPILTSDTSAHIHVTGSLSAVRVSPSHISPVLSLPNKLSPSQISLVHSLPHEPISLASTSTQVHSRSNSFTSDHVFSRSNSLTIEPITIDRFKSQLNSISPTFHEDSDSPSSITAQSYPYSDEELLVRYPKGQARRQRILQNTLSAEEAFHRLRVINNESSRRYRQRKHLAVKQMKDEEKILMARQNELKEQYDKLKHESDLYYSYFRRNYF